jgi:hypothetical protein
MGETFTRCSAGHFRNLDLCDFNRAFSCSSHKTRPVILQRYHTKRFYVLLKAAPTNSTFRLNPGEAVVHDKHAGKLLTVKKDILGPSFFAKRKFADVADYGDPKNGPQSFCGHFRMVLNHNVEVRRLRPSREFGSYPDWPTAYPLLLGQRHLEETIKEGCPCKPYLDLERNRGLLEGDTLETVIDAFQEATTRIF